MQMQDSSSLEKQKLPPYQLDNHSRNPLLVQSIHDQDEIILCKQVPLSLNGFTEASLVRKEGGGLLVLNTQNQYMQRQQLDNIKLQIITQQLSTFYQTIIPHLVNGGEIGPLATAVNLLTMQEETLVAMGGSWSKLLSQSDLKEVKDSSSHCETLEFKALTLEHSGVPKQEIDAQRKKIQNLKNALTQERQQFEKDLWQRDVEKKLLSRALSGAKKRFKGDEISHRQSLPLNALSNLQQVEERNSTLARYIQKEIAQMRLQFDNAQQSETEDQSQFCQEQDEQEFVDAELIKKLNKSEAFRKQLQGKIIRLSKERFDLESLLLELRAKLSGDMSIEQMQITTLQCSLNEAQDTLEQAKATYQQREQELQALLDESASRAEQTAKALGGEIEQLQQALEENRALLSDAKAEQQQSESKLHEALEKAQQTADENRAQYEAKITTLQQQINAQESSRQQMLQEKAELANTLQAETNRALEFAQHVQSLIEQNHGLEEQLKTLQHSFNDAGIEHQNDLALLREELSQARHTIDELEQERHHLDEALQQIKTLESTRQQMVEEKAELASSLQVEIDRSVEFTEQVQSLVEQRQSLKHDLEETRQALNDIRAQYQNDMGLLKYELEQARHTIDELGQIKQQLDDELQQAQADLQAQKELLSQSIEAEKRQAIKDTTRLQGTIKSLKSQLKAVRTKEIQHRKKRVNLEQMLTQEQQSLEQLKQVMKNVEKEAESTKIRLSEMEESQQQLLLELKHELKEKQKAWEMSEESEIALLVAKQEHVSRTDDLEQEIGNLQAQLEYLEQSSKEILSRKNEANTQLQQSLDEQCAELKMAESTFQAMKKDRESIHEAKSILADQFAQLEKESRKKEVELKNALESSRQEAISLRQKLTTISGLSANADVVEDLYQVLQRTEDEKAILKHEVAGLREVQLEMERQLDGGRDSEIIKLRGALVAAERKCGKAEKRAQQAEILERERQAQEVAIEILGEDLDALTREKASLKEELDRLYRELNEIRR
jgi:chromosome segregation ATPase